MPRVSDEHVRQRREQIIASARQLFEQRGLAHVTMAEIIAASGLSTGAVYSYFESKEALVLAVCMSGFTDVPGQIARHRTAREALAWLFDLIADPVIGDWDHRSGVRARFSLSSGRRWPTLTPCWPASSPL